jgi:hypothetical protein
VRHTHTQCDAVPSALPLTRTPGIFDLLLVPNQVEDEQYQLKPMNCPFHIEVYRDNMFSYRDLPIRWAELGTVYRYERSGTMHGLFRVRGFTQDDAHIFCLPNQIAQVHMCCVVGGDAAASPPLPLVPQRHSRSLSALPLPSYRSLILGARFWSCTKSAQAKAWCEERWSVA